VVSGPQKVTFKMKTKTYTETVMLTQTPKPRYSSYCMDL